MKRVADLRRMSNDQLKNRLNDINNTLLRLQGKRFAGAGTNPGFHFKIRKEKARILTILRERELAKARGG